MIDHAIERQASLLGCMVADPECISDIILKVDRDMLLTEPLRLLWDCFVELNDKGARKLDLIAVRDAAGSKWDAIGGAAYFGKINELEFSSASASLYIDEIVEFHRKTKLAGLASELSGILQSDKRSDDIISDMEIAISSLNDSTRKVDTQHMKDVECSFELEDNRYLPTQYLELNAQIIGFGSTALIAVIGSTGMGKSSLILDLLLHFGYHQNLPCALFSCELTNRENKQRLCCNLSDKSYKNVIQGYCSGVDKEFLYEASKQLSGKPIFLDKTPGLTSAELRRKVTTLHRREGIEIAFVDHLHRMKMPRGCEGRRQGLAQIAREIKDLATEIEIPIVLGAQVSRECSREKRRPTMYDIRDCGEVEEQCDLILAPFRPSHYGLTEPDVILELKGRNCGKGECEVEFISEYSSFRPIQGVAGSGEYLERILC